MAELINTSKRRLIPRWHTSRKMEFLHPSTPINHRKEDANLFFIEDKKAVWSDSSSISNATDLFVSLKLANMSEEPIFKEVEKYLFLNKEVIGNSINNIISPRLRKIDPSNNYATNRIRIYEIIKTLKQFVIECPQDSLTWNDLAFYYAVIGEQVKAEHCMHVASLLRPKHTLIARAHARLLIHNEEPEKALHILKKTGLVKVHPELLSADISIRTAFDIGRADISSARKLVKQHVNHPFLISELSASIGTIEIESGSVKTGKKFLETSALCPTENTVAQLKWMSQQHKINTPLPNSSVKSLEAEAISSYNNKKYLECRDSLMTLHRFQPFSEGALVDAGYLSLIALDDSKFICDSAEYFGEDVLSSFSAKNNYIVAKLDCGLTDGVEKLIDSLSSLVNSDEDAAVLSATQGLYMYSIGEIEGGRKLYNIANSYFKSRKFYFGHALSLLHQGISERRIDASSSLNILNQAKKEAKKITRSPELIDKINREIEMSHK